MKKNVMKRLFAVALTAAMVGGSLAGCGGSEPAAPAEAPAEQEAEKPAESAEPAAPAAQEAPSEAPEAVDVSAEPGIAGWEPFAEKVELEVAVYNRDNPDWANPQDNYWTQYVQKNFGDAYNINVTYVPIPRGAVLENYALLAADQDLPTILMEYDFPKQAKWAADGYLQTFDLNEFAKVAPTYYQRMVDLNQLGYTQLNGETYFCLAERPYSDTNYTWVTFYRKDWLKEAGFDEYPTTWTEQKKLYDKLIELGHDHPLGGAALNGVGADQNYSFRTFPQDETTWATVGDYAIPALSSEANRKFLKRENEKYNAGYINPEYYITDIETDKANFVSGKTFQYSGYINSEIDFVTGVYANNPDAELGVYYVPADKAVDAESDWVPGAFRANNPFGMMVSFAFDATPDELKAAWMYMEWMTQEENLFAMQWGEEGVTFDYDASGLPVAKANADIPAEKLQGFNNNKDVWCVTIEAKKAGTIEDVIKANTPQGTKDDLTTPVIDQYYAQKKIYEAGYGVTDCLFATDITAVTDNQTTLVANYVVYRDQLVQAKPEEFDKLYDELAQKYLDDGFQAVIDEREQAYKDGLSSKLN